MNNNYSELNDELNDELNNKNNNFSHMKNQDINKYNLKTHDDFNIWDIGSIFKYILSKPVEFLLLISVFFIIYSVDYISRINSAIYGVSQGVPFMGQQSQQPQNPLQLLQEKKKKRNK